MSKSQFLDVPVKVTVDKGDSETTDQWLERLLGPEPKRRSRWERDRLEELAKPKAVKEPSLPATRRHFPGVRKRSLLKRGFRRSFRVGDRPF